MGDRREKQVDRERRSVGEDIEMVWEFW